MAVKGNLPNLKGREVLVFRCAPSTSPRRILSEVGRESFSHGEKPSGTDNEVIQDRNPNRSASSFSGFLWP